MWYPSSHRSRKRRLASIASTSYQNALQRQKVSNAALEIPVGENVRSGRDGTLARLPNFRSFQDRQTGSSPGFAFAKDDKGVVRAKNGCGTKIRSDWLTGTALRPGDQLLSFRRRGNVLMLKPLCAEMPCSSSRDR